MTRSLPHGSVRRAVVLHSLLALVPLAAAAAGTGEPPPPPQSSSPSEAAPRLDSRTLERELIPEFVKARAAPTRMEQMARWHEPVCPQVAGVPPDYANTVTARLLAAAQAAGAPNAGVGHSCSPNITILFTQTPQQLLDRIDKDHAALLGSGRVKGDTTFSRAIQAWYLTGTLQLSGSGSFPVQALGAPGVQGVPMGAGGMGRSGGAMGMGMGMSMNNGGAMAPPAPPPITANIPEPVPSTRVVPDPAWDNAAAVGGGAGRGTGLRFRSELLHVTLVADAHKLDGMSLQTVSDYMAFLALTRVTALEACTALPSIMDLLASGCADRDKPATLSAADTALLKALYASSLEGKIGIEQAEVNKKMLRALKAQTH